MRRGGQGGLNQQSRRNLAQVSGARQRLGPDRAVFDVIRLIATAGFTQDDADLFLYHWNTESQFRAEVERRELEYLSQTGQAQQDLGFHLSMFVGLLEHGDPSSLLGEVGSQKYQDVIRQYQQEFRTLSASNPRGFEGQRGRQDSAREGEGGNRRIDIASQCGGAARSVGSHSIYALGRMISRVRTQREIQGGNARGAIRGSHGRIRDAHGPSNRDARTLRGARGGVRGSRSAEL